MAIDINAPITRFTSVAVTTEPEHLTAVSLEIKGPIIGGGVNKWKVTVEAAAGSPGASCTVEGSPISGIITLQCGGANTAIGRLVIFTLPVGMATAPTGIILTPANANTVGKKIYLEVTNLSIKGNGALAMLFSEEVLTPGNFYKWNYIAIPNN